MGCRSHSNCRIESIGTAERSCIVFLYTGKVPSFLDKCGYCMARIMLPMLQLCFELWLCAQTLRIVGRFTFVVASFYFPKCVFVRDALTTRIYSAGRHNSGNDRIWCQCFLTFSGGVDEL